jgi:phospholipase C
VKPVQPSYYFSIWNLSCLGAALALASALTACGTARLESASNSRLEHIQNVVVIYAENHSFDNIYGLFPGANGLANATQEQKLQLDHDGQPLHALLVFGPDGTPDASFSAMPNAPFRIETPPVSRSTAQIVPSPTHLFYNNQEQINGG